MNQRDVLALIGPMDREDLERLLVILAATAPEAFGIAVRVLHEADPTPTGAVREGQVWEDNDKRAKGRRVQVVSVDTTHATVAPMGSLDGRWTRIRLDRFKPTSTGYRLIHESEGGEKQ